MTKQIDDFGSENEVKSNWVKFSKIEDKVLGTLTRITESESQFNPGEKVKNYEIKADYGSFHTIDDMKKVVEPAVELVPGEFWMIGGKASIERQMANIKIGQKVGFKFVDEKPSKTKGFAPSKLIKVFTPKNDDGSYKMDEEFLKGDDGAF
jgi:hypothetical protein